jgi:hypothetical protein
LDLLCQQKQNLGMELSWTEVNDINTARDRLGAAGASNTAALAFGGNDHP